ncbi:MAG: type II toxin-antitoxin system RelE/ParE family toxin [bacterium]|nr:type II toxin-antitoxin system RelE/ParE family toxin [bacterium]
MKSFKDRETEKVFGTLFSKRFPPDIQRRAMKRMKALSAAAELSDLAALPGNHLEALKGDRKGQHSIRINDQWRVCFVWKDGEAHGVEITDYH